jgi:hypothetical protein
MSSLEAAAESIGSASGLMEYLASPVTVGIDGGELLAMAQRG